jgi:hypothetical protein
VTPRWLTLPTLAALAACGGADDSATVGGVTPSEAKALNDAAAMLDESAANSAGAPPSAEAPVPAS